MVFAPGLRVTDRLQFAVPAPTAVPPLAATPFMVTEEIPLFPRPESLAVPATVIGLLLTAWLLLWLVIATAGPVVSGAVYVTVKVAVPALLAASRAVTVSTLLPGCNTIPLADHVVVPVAVPLPPALLLHVTCVTPMLSAAVPPRVIGLVVVLYVAPVVGLVIVTVGGVGSYVTVICTVVAF